MRKTAADFTDSRAQRPTQRASQIAIHGDNCLTVAEFDRYATDWVYDGEYRQNTTRTLQSKKFILDKMRWFLQHRQYTHFGATEIRRFIAYVGNGHLEPGGRWGNPRLTTPPRPVSVRGYYVVLHGFCEWLVEEEILPTSPMAKLQRPIVRSEQPRPFTTAQVGAILQAARQSPYARRDEALIRFLLDTGLRSDECCSLRMGDLDVAGRSCVVLGKGNKRRTVYFGRNAARALWKYLGEYPREATDGVFLSERGTRAGEPLTNPGLRQMVRRLCRTAGITGGVKTSPHTFRHTFAFLFTENGGNAFTLQQILGHTSLAMTKRYVALVSANMQAQHRQFSPGDRLGK